MTRKKMTETEKFLMKLKKERKKDRESLNRDLEDCKELRIPDPAYLHKVGDRVVYGAWNFTEILEICEGGKYYKCYSCTLHNDYGRKKWGDKVHYQAWYGLELYREKSEYPDRMTEDEDVHFQTYQSDMHGLLYRMFDRHGIDLYPDYQRGNVWTLQQKKALIDSMFKNVDIGKFAVIKREWGNNPHAPKTKFLSEMLDGKQRLTAIWEYFIGRFKYKGLYFHELHPWDQEHIERYKISVSETSALTDEQKYRYFLKLNTSGTPISKEHLDRVKKLWLDAQFDEDINEVYYEDI